MTSARIICRGEVPESIKELARGREVFGRVAFGHRVGGASHLSRFASQPKALAASRIHLTVNDALVGEVLAERHRRDRIDPCWRATLIEGRL